VRLGLPFVVLLIALNASAQSDGGTGVLTKAPSLLRSVEAVYPADAADAGSEGTVVMTIDLSADGHVTDAKVVQSAGAAFDDAALAAVRQFEFAPAEVDGQPAAVRLSYSYHFFMRHEVVEAPATVADAGPVINFTGKLIERGTRVAIPGAAVVLDGERETYSADDGTFAFEDVPAGQHHVVVSASDYNKYEVTEDVVEGRRTQVTYHVRRKVYGGYETVVRDEREKKEVAQITLKQEEIRLIPGTNGDAFRVVQNLPGVARAPFGLGALIVRGGKQWDTRVYVDDIFIPQLFHFGGLYATFNANLLDTLSFEPGNFGAGFGRSIGGLVLANTRTPQTNGYHGFVDINVVDASALVEGPIAGNWSFSVSGRRSYIDALLPFIFDTFIPSAKNSLSFTVAPRYYDYQVRVEWKPPNGKSRFFVSLFGSDDKLEILLPNPAFDPEGRSTFGTAVNYNRLTVGYDHAFSDTLRFKTRNSLGLDHLDVSIGSDIYFHGTQYPIQSRQTFDWDVLKSLSLSFGLDFNMVPLTVNVQSPPTTTFKANTIPDPFFSKDLISDTQTYVYTEPAVFLEAMWKPVSALKVVGGLRADYEAYMKKAWADPRLAVFWSPFEDFTVKAAAGIYHQVPDYRIGALSPIYGNPDLQPEGAYQFMTGIEKRFSDAITLDVKGYYQELFNQARTTIGAGAGADLSMPATDLRYTSIGHGRSYGMELLLRHQLTKNFFGWIAYTLSRTERDYKGGTVWALGQFDQPHNLIAIASYKLPFDFIAGVRIQYVSGPLVTPAVGSVYDANGNYYFPLYGADYSRRLPDFFQLDIRLDKRFVFKNWMLSVYCDVQNVTNRRNVESLVNNFNYTKEAFLTGLPIIPVLGVKGEW
jgi:TonB family protein